ncbi:MAG: hypothetical protein H0W67_01740 [Gemmatimonadales bacterium]|nr:hypothetical protein [Gemmatimonadales bacterium]
MPIAVPRWIILVLGLAAGLVISARCAEAQDSTAAATADERWQVALGPDAYVWDVRLVRIDGAALVVRQVDSLVRIPVAKITEMRLIRKSEMQRGAAGGAMNALTGAEDEVYDFAPLDSPDKLRALQKIFRYHPVAPTP